MQYIAFTQYNGYEVKIPLPSNRLIFKKSSIRFCWYFSCDLINKKGNCNDLSRCE
jgi:hypothetical protein